MGKIQERKPRRKNFTREEIVELSAFVKEHREKLFGKAGHCTVKVEKRKKHYWTKAAHRLRVKGGAEARDWVEVRKKWTELKSAANKYNQMRTGGTGGGPQVAHNPIYEIVLDAIEKEAKDGLHPVESEAGFSSIDDSSQDDDLSLKDEPGQEAGQEAQQPVHQAQKSSPVNDPIMEGEEAGQEAQHPQPIAHQAHKPSQVNDPIIEGEEAGQETQHPQPIAHQAHKPSQLNRQKIDVEENDQAQAAPDDFGRQLLEIELQKVAIMKDCLVVGRELLQYLKNQSHTNTSAIGMLNSMQ